MKVELAEDFDAFYTATYRNLVGQIYVVCGSMAEAEDCVQEAYARAWQRWGQLTEHGQLEAWVRTVAYRLAVSSWRKAVKRLAAHRREHIAEPVPETNPDHLALIAGLRRISADQRVAIVLYHFAGLSTEDIADQTGSSVNTVKGRLARGRKALAKHVSEFADLAPQHQPTRAVTPQACGREN